MTCSTPPKVNPNTDVPICSLDITGREDKLRRVCGDDEGRDGLEEGVPAVLEAEVQQPQPEAPQGWIHQRRRSEID